MLHQMIQLQLREYYGVNLDQRILALLELIEAQNDNIAEEMLLTAQSIAARLRAASVPFFAMERDIIHFSAGC